MSIESTLPLWLVLPLVALAVFVAWILYVRKSGEPVIPRPVTILLAIVRGLVILAAGLLIISPWIRTKTEKKEMPVFIVAEDNSLSVKPEKNSAWKPERPGLSEQLRKEAGSRFEVRFLRFGEGVGEDSLPDYTDQLTDPGKLFDRIRTLGKFRTVAGVLMMTDGVATRGQTIAEAASGARFPVSFLASGDSTVFPDYRIQEVITNDWVRKNTLFPVRVYFNSGDLKDNPFTVRLSGQGVTGGEQRILNPQSENTFVEFLVKSPEKGSIYLTATLIPDKPDKNRDNNSKSVTVRVIDREGSVLILFDSPHPDVQALSAALAATGDYKVQAAPADGFRWPDKDPELVILHGIPSIRNPVPEILERIRLSSLPVLAIIGKQTGPEAFNSMQRGLSVSDRRKGEEAAKGIATANFNYFILPEDFNSHLSTWPPLFLWFQEYRPDPGSQVLVTQKILNIELNEPLICFSAGGGTKSGFVCGEGIWLWRLHEYLESGSHEYFDNLIGKTVQFLLASGNEEKFSVTVEDIHLAGTPVRFAARLLNESNEPVNSPDVLLTVSDTAGNTSQNLMGRVNEAYELTLGGFPAGEYSYVAETRLGEQPYRKDGVLRIMDIPVEQADPVADYASMRAVASSTGGRFFLPGDRDGAVRYLASLDPEKLPARIEFKWFDLINFKWLLPVLVLLLAVEWFLRRWFGIR